MGSVIRQTIFLVMATAALAQTATSRITGTVGDASGALVPGAMVTAKNEDTGVTYTQMTTEAGLYGFPSLPVGPYTITVALPGFKTANKTGNILEVNTPLVINMSLEVGGITETVSIAAEAEVLQTSNATIGNVVERKAIVDLPLNGRNPLALIALEPGVVQRSAGAAGSGIHVNGARDRSVNVTVDGIEANESSVPNPLSNLYRLTPDNVQEYKVTTNNATPEEGRNSGASVSAATRSGTSQFHGTFIEFVRTTALNANEFFASAQGTPKPEIKLHQFGFEAGGRIRKGKTFFFGSWQGQNTKFAQPIDQTFGGIPRMYTPAALSGIFRYFVADPVNPLVLNGQTITRNSPLLVDPATGAYRPGVHDCASASELNCVMSFNMFANDPLRIRADPKMLALFKTYPLPNSYIVGDGLNTAGYTWNPPTSNEGANYMARIDHSFNDRNTVFVRWLQADQNTRQGDPLNARPHVFPGFPPLGEVFRATRNLAISYRQTISSRVVNEFTAGFARFGFLLTQDEANPAFPDVLPFTSSPGGANNAFNNTVSFPYLKRPRTFRAVTTPQFLDNLSIVSGAHVFRTGANVRLYEHNDQRGQPGGTDVTPAVSFMQNLRTPAGFNTPVVGARSIDPTDSNNLNAAINDILGIPARLSQVFLGDLSANAFLPFRSGNKVTLWNMGHRLKQYNFYFQDEWRLRPNVTANYGVRWEINPAPSEAAGRVYVPDKPVGAGLITFRQTDRWYERNNAGAIAPRAGIAWSPPPNFLIPSGYGIAIESLS